MTSCSFSVMFFRSVPSCCFPKPDSGPGSNYLTHTCTLLTSSFLSTTFPLTIFFFHIVVRILFLKHHFHHTPPPAASNCIKSKLQVPSHCLDHYLLYSWTPLQPSKRPDTVYTMLQHAVNSVNSVRSSVNHLDVLSTRRQTSGLTEEIYCVDGGFFFLNSVDQMFWHYVDTSLSPTFVLMACPYNFLFTWNRTCLLDAMFSLPSKLWSEFPPPQSSSRLIPLNHNLGSF